MRTSKPRVLVVESRPSTLRLLESILERSYEVRTAPSGAAALTLIHAGSFDVVLTDVRAPSAHAFELLRTVQETSSATAVLIMAAYADIPDAVAGMRLGAFDYLPIPLDPDDVLLTVARAVEYLRERGLERRSGGLGSAKG
jgi:DNA-binding NtrC family response regulator